MRKLVKDLFHQAFKQGSYGRRNFKLYMRHFSHYKQRLAKGFDDSETWSVSILDLWW